MPIFTAGIFLLSGLAIAVPLALHLLHKRQPQPILFGAVRFMRDAIAKSRRSRHLTQGLTLLMRCLILLLLACAFAKPFIEKTNYLPSGQRKLMLVIDASASMQTRDGDRTIFEKSQAWAATILDTLQKNDMASLVIAAENGPAGAFMPIQDHEHIAALISDAKCSQGAVDLASQIRTALAEDGGQLQNFELHVFSDFQQGSWRKDSIKMLSEELEHRHAAVFLNCPLGANVSDAGISNLKCVPAAIVGDGPYSCVYDMSHTENYAGSMTVRLTGDGQEQDQLTVVLPGAELSDRLTGQAGTSESNAELTGYVTVDEDSYTLNDRRFYSLPRLNGQPALIVNGSNDDRDSFFLTRALKPRGAAFSHVVPEVKDWPGFLNTSDLSPYTMIFLCNPPRLDSGATAHLKHYVEAGGLAVVFPGSQDGVTAPAIQALCGPDAIALETEALPDTMSFQLTAEAQGTDMLTRRMVTMIPPPWNIAVKRRLPLKLKQNTLKRFVSYVVKDHFDGFEFMTRQTIGNGELIVCSVSANRDWSDLPLTPFYFVMVQELARHGAGYRHRELQTTVGGELAIPMQGTKLTTDTLHATDMGGRKIELACKTDTSGKMLLVSGFHTIGIITIELPWNATKQLAVNLPDSENSLTYWKQTELTEGHFTGVPVVLSASSDELKRQMTLAGHSFALSPWLLIAAFVLSMVEVLYANLRSRRALQPKLVGTLLKNGGGVA